METYSGPTPPKYVPDEKTEAEINNWFQYHSPKDDQAGRYELLRNAAKTLALQIVCNVPNCADRTAAIRKLRECIFTANAAIACNE